MSYAKINTRARTLDSSPSYTDAGRHIFYRSHEQEFDYLFGTDPNYSRNRHVSYSSPDGGGKNAVTTEDELNMVFDRIGDSVTFLVGEPGTGKSENLQFVFDYNSPNPKVLDDREAVILPNIFNAQQYNDDWSKEKPKVEDDPAYDEEDRMYDETARNNSTALDAAVAMSSTCQAIMKKYSLFPGGIASPQNTEALWDLICATNSKALQLIPGKAGPETCDKLNYLKLHNPFMYYASLLKLCLIKASGHVARLVVIRAGPEPDLCVSDLTELLADYIAEYMFSRQSVNYSGNAVFGGLVADLIEFRLTDPDEVIRRLKGVELSVQRYYHVMLVAFPEDQGSLENIPWNYIISQLELLFPFSDITTYRGEILLLIRKTNRGTRPRFDQPALETLLERHNGQAAIGNFSEFLTSLPPIYYQTKNVLRLGRIMDPGKRLYFFEDYSMYHLVEMADMGAQGALYSRNIVYLCHPGLITLLRYDKKTGASLTDTLYVYLRCERNAAEAAKQLFIHRNTMLNKVRRIEEVLGQSLEDPWLRERLLFSYHVLEYMRKYRREDILILHRNAVAADGKREDKRESE